MRVPQVPRRSGDENSMVPMIDVTFNLLVFFVVAGSGATAEKLLSANLPSQGRVQANVVAAPSDPWKVEVFLKLRFVPETKTFSVDMNGTEYTDVPLLKEQLSALADVDKSNPIILEVGDRVPVGRMVEIYDACKASGFSSISFAANARASG
jgi:biopolymer transport protein ExbD